MARHMNKRKGAAGIIVIALLIIIVIGVFSLLLPHNEKVATVDDVPLSEVLKADGFEGEIADWFKYLNDEQMAILDMAFESAVDEGFKGTKEEWVTNNAVARHDANGDTVITLPDGGEFSYFPQEQPGNGSEKDSIENPEQKTPDAPGGDEDARKSDSKSTDETEKATKGSGIEDTRQDDGQVNPNDTLVVVSVDQVHVRKGETKIAVPVRITGNPGVLGMTLCVSYDESAMTLTKAENGEAFAGFLNMTHSKSFSSGALFTWDGVDVEAKDVKDGVILTLYFDVSSDASGLYAVAVRSGGAAVDANLNEIPFVVDDGNVVIG